MIDLNLDAIKERRNAIASEPTWEAQEIAFAPGFGGRVKGLNIQRSPNVIDGGSSVMMSVELAEFIAHSREDIDVLIAYVHERDRITNDLDFEHGDLYSEDGYCVACGNGSWKSHIPECKIAELQDRISELELHSNMAKQLDELLKQVVEWSDAAGLGDNGELASFEITRVNRRWEIRGYSFYDGSGWYRGKDLLEGIRTVFREIEEEPEKEKAREFESAYRSLARWKDISWDKAKSLLEGLE